MFFRHHSKTESASASQLQEIVERFESLERKVKSCEKEIFLLKQPTEWQRGENTGFVRLDNLAQKIASTCGETKAEVRKWLYERYGSEIVIFGKNRKGFPKSKADFIFKTYKTHREADEAGNRKED